MDLEQLKQWEKSGKVELSAQITPGTINAESRTVDVVFYSGADVQRYSFFEGAYILAFDPSGVDLGYLNSGAPVLDNHDSMSGAAGQKGVVDKAWSENGKYLATLRFSKRSEVDGLWQDIQDKVVTKFSMGTEILEAKDTRNKDGKLQRRTATSWRPFEISVAPIPADFGTTTLSADNAGDTGASAPNERTNMNPTLNGSAEAPKTPEPVVDKAALELAAKEAARLERERQAVIRTRVKAANLSAEFADTLCNEDVTVEAASTKIFAELAKTDRQRGETRNTNSTGIQFGADERETHRELMSNAVMHAFDTKNELTTQNPYRGMPISRIAEESLIRSGAITRFHGKSKPEIAMLAMYGTSDFPLLLENSARKRLLQAYSYAQPTYKLWSVANTTPDFKTMSRYRLSETPSFIAVPEGAQITIGSMSESREQYAIGTLGRGVAFTRQMLINDDLGAFNNLLMAFGVQASRVENKTAYAILTANAAMSDSVALFHASHGNLGSGALGNTAFNSMVTAMATQKGADGVTVLNLSPKILVVPVALGVTARTTQMTIGPNVKVSDQNWFAGRFDVVADAELDGSSTAVYYAFADPSIAPAVEYSYLEGAAGPQMLRKENEDAVLGIQLYAYLDFGVKAIDWRSAYKSTGV